MRGRFGRFLASVVVAACAVALMLPGPASARSDKWTFLESEPWIDEGLCEFPVLFEAVVNQEYAKDTYDADGNWVLTLITGRFVAKITNVDEPTSSIVVNASGPAKSYPVEGGVIVEAFGHLLFNGPGLYLRPGHTFLFFGDDGSFEWTHTGHSVDLCQLLS